MIRTIKGVKRSEQPPSPRNRVIRRVAAMRLATLHLAAELGGQTPAPAGD
jgi:hypothetical protein